MIPEARQKLFMVLEIRIVTDIGEDIREPMLERFWRDSMVGYMDIHKWKLQVVHT